MKELQELVGKKVKRIFLNQHLLKFDTDQGKFVFGVEGDCCSSSYFHDFVGVKKLLENGPILNVRSIDLSAVEAELNKDSARFDVIQVYGYEFVTVHPEFGEQTSVLAFRNSSNGYYGGWMNAESHDQIVSPEIFDDVLEAEEAGKTIDAVAREVAPQVLLPAAESMPTEITREEATALMQAQMGQPMARVVIAFAGKWYDVRGMSDEDFEAFTKVLIGDRSVEIKHVDL